MSCGSSSLRRGIFPKVYSSPLAMDSAALLSSSPSPFCSFKQQPLCLSTPLLQGRSVSSCGRPWSRSLPLHSHVALLGARIPRAPPNTSLQWRERCMIVSASSAASSMPSSSSDSPPSPSLPISDIVWPASGAFVAMVAMSYLDKLVEPMGLTFTIAPFGAVCAVLFATPTTPAAKKYNMFVAHIGCAAMGIAALALFGPGWLARGTALAASIAFMQLTGSMHPPAAGLPLLFIDVPKFHQLQLWYLIFPSAVGCILLCLLQEVVMFMKKRFRF